jgi:hypothetical protein
MLFSLRTGYAIPFRAVDINSEAVDEFFVEELL